MVIVGLRLDAGNSEKQLIEISEDLLLLAVAAATVMALVGFALVISFMNRQYRRTFFGRFSFRQYIVELWESRTYARVGNGLDASRADVIVFSR